KRGKRFICGSSVRADKRCPDLLPAVLADSCPDGWVGYRKKCYYFSLTEGNWTVGNIYCSSHNASLAVIDSQKEKVGIKIRDMKIVEQ
uniref:Uncharacterized protein n=1 Tax=Anolis carolinensis TaxID=28377 RepID=H9GKG6_ANOCA